MTKFIRLLLVLTLLMAASCQRKELIEPHNHHNLYVKASFDSTALSQLMSAQRSSYSKPGEPATTKYILYDKLKQRVAYTGEFQGLEGGLYAKEGIYDLLLYTTDFNELDANFFRGMDDPSTAETYTRQSPIEGTRADVQEMYMVEPDPTFSELKEDLIVYRVEEGDTLHIELVQKSFKYYLTIRVTGLYNIHSAKMNISGMYTTAFLAHEEHRMDEAGTQSLDLELRNTATTPEEREAGVGELYGEFWSFGPHAREDIQNSITLYFINGDVTTKKLSDLTSQIKKLVRGGEIIVEEVIDIKGPAGGFDPGVGDWEDTNVDLYL